MLCNNCGKEVNQKNIDIPEVCEHCGCNFVEIIKKEQGLDDKEAFSVHLNDVGFKTMSEFLST